MEEIQLGPLRSSKRLQALVSESTVETTSVGEVNEGFEYDEEIPVEQTTYSSETNTKTVTIHKNQDPLGVTIRNEKGSIIIGRVIKGGVIERSSVLKEGDEILEVNCKKLQGLTVNEACDIIEKLNGILTFTVRPYSEANKLEDKADHVPVTRLKALFDWDPIDDAYLPCQELGVRFQRGDVLHVVSQNDKNWWQAFRDGEDDQPLAGLIPSINFHQEREVWKRRLLKVHGKNDEMDSNNGNIFNCFNCNNKKDDKSTSSEVSLDPESIMTYEEVEVYFPKKNRKRPIVLVGPSNIGKNKLREKLLKDKERFAPAVSHTSRERKITELEGFDYYFISKSQFEEDITNEKFVEYGQYKNAYYGTSIQAIKEVIDIGKSCVLSIDYPQFLTFLRRSCLNPFVVFIAPPSINKLQKMELKLGSIMKDKDLKDIIESARKMEEKYGHYFDCTIFNHDLDKSYVQLLTEVNQIERQPQWVPKAWMSDPNFSENS